MCHGKRCPKQKYCCSPIVDHFDPQNFGLAAPLFILAIECSRRFITHTTFAREFVDLRPIYSAVHHWWMPRRSVTREREGVTTPGRRMAAGGAVKSQQCRKYFLQYSTFCSRKTLDSNTGAPNLLLAPGPNLVTPLIQLQGTWSSWPAVRDGGASGTRGSKRVEGDGNLWNESNRYQLCLFLFSKNVDLKSNDENERKPFWIFWVRK